MSLSSSHHDLFHQPSTAEKIAFVRSLIETGDLNADIAMALLKSIHSELAHPQEWDHSLYASYARMMASLQHKMPEVHQHVVANWQAPRRLDTSPEGLLAEEGFIEPETSGEVSQTKVPQVGENEQGERFWEAEGETEAAEVEIEEQEEGSESEEKQETEQEENTEIANHEEEEPEAEDREQEKEAEPELEDPEEEENKRGEEPLEEPEVEESAEGSEKPEASERPETPEGYQEEAEETEKPEAEVSKEADGTEANETAEEGERMATEAAEAAAHMEHAENEVEVGEEESMGEEEPPLEAAE